MKKTIRIYTNIVSGGWSANTWREGIGGSEECLIMWCEEMSKEYDITVYMNGEYGLINGVNYTSHKNFKPWEYSDIFISFKSLNIFQNSINARKKIHWSCDIEKIENHVLEELDNVVAISKFHKDKLGNSQKIVEIGMFFNQEDFRQFIDTEKDQEETVILYSSSYDRGLEDLLRNWELVKKKLGLDKLKITYGWDFYDKVHKHNVEASKWKYMMIELMNQSGIEVLGKVDYTEMIKLYHTSHYWCLPLNNDNAELFCINAIKAQYAGAIPVVNCLGGLQTTVNEFVPWKKLLNGEVVEVNKSNNVLHASKFTLTKIVEKWKQIL